MSPFRRKRDGEDETAQEPVEAAEGEPDPAAWALPADAGAVTSDSGTAATDAVAPVPEAATVVEPDPVPVTPEPVAAYAPPAPAPDPEPAAGGDITAQRPELLVAGAFAGAFLFARILKHITSDD